MDRLIYLAMSGAKATMQRQETLANNLANVSTLGFRAELAAFRAVPVEGSGASTRVYALESTPGYDATPGQVAATGRNLDVAMQGAAWLAVQGLDGTEAYTRGGSLDINADGNLVTTSGLTVLGDGGPIQIPPDNRVGIAADGTVSVTDVNGHSNSVGKLKLVTPEGPLTRGSDGLFRAPAGELSADPLARVQDGALEGSNVSAVETMVAMIAAARQFEAQMKSLTTAEGNDKVASQLLSVS
jgi:flagellar basal-body rod protein FlgF